jgi:acyl-CoA synthetase (AMP-forming)/AMP-acid ligase II
VKLGGEGFETRVVDGILHVRAASAMLGYLNAPSPFDAEGWLNTGDEVEFDETGEYMRIRGRRSEIINVGGEKVFPAEVESVLLQMPGVRDVAVTAQSNPLTGQMVAARFCLSADEPLAALRTRVREHCRGKLQPYKIPSKIEIAAADLHSDRFKKMRRSA